MALRDAKSLGDVEGAASGGKPVVLHFWASWCEPCKHMDTVAEQLSKELPGVAFLRVEAEVVDEVTIKYDVATVPTFVFLKGGAVVDRLEGADPPALTQKATALAGGGAAAAAPAPSPAPAPPAASSTAPDVFGRVKFILSQWPVVLAMKGTESAPRCGFSGRVVEALHKLGVQFKSVDILQDEALRQGLKEYSNWPTYPQLYIKGELVGGCDIVTELAGSGELEGMFKEKLGQDFRSVAAAAVANEATLAAPSSNGHAAAAPAPATAAATSSGGGSGANVTERLKALVSQSPVMLFMKGTPEAPRCGFSRKVAEALKSENLEFGSFDILEDEAVRQGLKEYSNWPTYPQLYVRGELVGGCDIVLEMHQNGELGSSVREMIHRMDVP